MVILSDLLRARILVFFLFSFPFSSFSLSIFFSNSIFFFISFFLSLSRFLLLLFLLSPSRVFLFRPIRSRTQQHERKYAKNVALPDFFLMRERCKNSILVSFVSPISLLLQIDSLSSFFPKRCFYDINIYFSSLPKIQDQ